jgi:beta-glucanase (GH16 family)
MKKIFNLFIIFTLVLILVSCETNNNDNSVPNGMLPLVPINDCLMPRLDSNWVCIWADEFNGNQVDEEKWTFVIDGQGGGNNELQYYRRENAEVKDGKLIITARNESFMGRTYTSARIHSKYKGDFQYVRVVVSAKMPSGRGTWPAIWMMPTMNAYGGWPFSGEIDIMEYVGYDVNRVHSTIHTRSFNHNIGTQVGNAITVPNVETEFKEYEMIWGPGSIVTYVDGLKIAEFGYAPHFNRNIPYHHAFPFDQLFHLILNLAVGGNWGGVQGVDETAFPTTMEIDYVRVYQLDYATIDKTPPTIPTLITLAELRNTIYWRASTDDAGVEKYAIYLNGELRDHARLNQYTFTGLQAGQTYQIEIEAIDFVGRRSGKSEIFSLFYS